MEGAGAPAFELGNVNRHDFGPYEIQRHILAFSTNIPDIRCRKDQAMHVNGSELL